MSTTQNETSFGVGIVGCGSISGIHAEAILRSKNGRLIAAQSRTKASLDGFCNRFDVQGYTSFDEFLNLPELDVVVICTPSGTHLDYGMAAAKAGKHVVVEKPIEITTTRGRTLIDCCRDHDVQLAVIYQNRYIADAISMKQAVDQGDIGNCFMANASVKWFRDQEYYSGSDWRGTLALDGGGAVINQAIHTLDLLQWVAGKVKAVQAFKGTFTHPGIEAEDNAVASLKFQNGAIGVFVASTSVVPAQERDIEVFGEKGTAKLKGDLFQLILAGGEEATGQESESVGADNPMAGMNYQSHQRQYEQIFESIRNGQTPPVSGDESLQSLAIVEALYKSAESGRLIEIEEILS